MTQPDAVHLSASQPLRLKKRGAFLAVQKRGSRRRGQHIHLEALTHNQTDAPTRVGFTVTKRQGNAVVRNRIKRRLREAVRLYGASCMRNGTDYVLVGKQSAQTASFSELVHELKRLISASHEPSRQRQGQRHGK